MERGRQRRGGRKMWVCVAEPQGMHSFNWTIKCLVSVSIFYVCRKRRLECINTQVSLHANVSTDNAPEMIHWWSCEVIWIVIQLDLTELQLSDEFWIQNMSTSVTPLTYFPSFSPHTLTLFTSGSKSRLVSFTDWAFLASFFRQSPFVSLTCNGNHLGEWHSPCLLTCQSTLRISTSVGSQTRWPLTTEANMSCALKKRKQLCLCLSLLIWCLL